MVKKKQETRQFYDVMHEYEASLKEYTEAASMLNAAVRTAIQLVDDGLDAKLALEHLRYPSARFEKAAYGSEGKDNG